MALVYTKRPYSKICIYIYTWWKWLISCSESYQIWCYVTIKAVSFRSTNKPILINYKLKIDSETLFSPIHVEVFVFFRVTAVSGAFLRQNNRRSIGERNKQPQIYRRGGINNRKSFGGGNKTANLSVRKNKRPRIYRWGNKQPKIYRWVILNHCAILVVPQKIFPNFHPNAFSLQISGVVSPQSFVFASKSTPCNPFSQTTFNLFSLTVVSLTLSFYMTSVRRNSLVFGKQTVVSLKLPFLYD